MICGQDRRSPCGQALSPGNRMRDDISPRMQRAGVADPFREKSLRQRHETASAKMTRRADRRLKIFSRNYACTAVVNVRMLRPFRNDDEVPKTASDRPSHPYSDRTGRQEPNGCRSATPVLPRREKETGPVSFSSDIFLARSFQNGRSSTSDTLSDDASSDAKASNGGSPSAAGPCG